MNVLKQETIKSEIMWYIEVVMCNYSYHSREKKNDLFLSIYPDSEIAFQFRSWKTKCAYMVL